MNAEADKQQETVTQTSPLDLLQVLKAQTRGIADSLRAQQEILTVRGIKLLPELFDILSIIDEDVERLEGRITEDTTTLDLLRALAGAAEQINSSLDPDEVLNQAMERVITLTGAERGYIILSNANPFELSWDVRVAHGPDQDLSQGPEFKGSRTIVREVLESGQSVMTNNAGADPRFADNNTVAAQNLRSIMCVPLKHKADVIGAVYVDNRLRAGLFTPESESLLSAFAHQAAIAIGNARLFARVQENLDTIAELKELMDNIFASIGGGVITTDVDEMITICNPAAERIFGCKEDEVRGKPLASLIPEANSDILTHLHEVHESRDNQIVDAEIDSPSLGHLSVNVKISPIKDSDADMQGVALVLNDLTKQRENEEMLRSFRRYLPPNLVDNIHTIAGIALGGERHETTCIYVDVRPLSSFPADLRPEQIMERLNVYLSAATVCIHETGGLIDKYMGQEIMGLFNSQLNLLEDHAARAVKAALDIRKAFVALYKEQGIDPDPHYYRIGMHTGIATLGNVGSEIRRDFTAIGDSINLSKRLEETATAGQILVSEDLRRHIEQHPGVLSLDTVRFEPRGAVTVKGRKQPVDIYEVFAQDDH